MSSRPHVLLSVATSLDGYIDDASSQRLLLSNEEDFDRVDEVRAGVDAILIGAETLRRDNPRLLVNSEDRRTAREARGESAFPLKVTVTATGNLEAGLKFWHSGGAKVIYTNKVGAQKLGDRLSGLAEVVVLGEEVDFDALLRDLGQRGVRQLMVEGGGRIHTAFLAGGLADEIHLAIAPILVGDARAPRFLLPATYPGGPAHRMRLVNVRQVGDIALLHYLTEFAGD